MGNIDPSAPQGNRSWVRVNRNLLNYPFATDRRCVLEWQQQGDARVTQLNDDVTLSLPLDFRERAPDAFDVQALLALLHLADGKKTKSSMLLLDGKADLLERMGRSTKNAGRALTDALDLWKRLSLTFERWHVPKSKLELGGNSRRTLPPPIVQWWFAKGQLRVEIHSEWVALLQQRGFFAWVPSILPKTAAAQNLALFIRSVPVRKKGDAGWLESLNHYTRRRLATKIGLRSNRRGAALQDILQQVDLWLRDLGGGLAESGEDANGVTFIFHLPGLPKRKPVPAKTKSKAKAKTKGKPKKTGAQGVGSNDPYQYRGEDFLARGTPRQRHEL